MIKEYVHIKKGQTSLFKFTGFMRVQFLMDFFKHINQFEIEYIVETPTVCEPYANFFIRGAKLLPLYFLVG